MTLARFGRYVAASTAIAIAILAGACAPPAPRHDFDVLIFGGTIVDGSGAPPYNADVGIQGERIAALGDLSTRRGAIEIDATGRVVAPGFIDLHSHADLILLADAPRRSELLQAKMRQGVTTVIVGNCGLGVAPANPTTRDILAGVNAWMTPEGVTADAGSFAAWLDRLDREAFPLNVGSLVPHGPIRIDAMGLAQGSPDDAALAEMRRAVGDALDAGAFGLSVGLIYPPGMFSPTAELARPRRGGRGA